MAFVKPSRPQFKPEQQLKIPGAYFAKCVRVEQGMPWEKFPAKTLIAIEFELNDPRFPELAGKITSAVLPESLYFNKRDGKKSAFYMFSVTAGVPSPDKGYDPETYFLDRHFYIVCESLPDREDVVVRQAVVIPNAKVAPNAKEPLPAVPVVPPLDGDIVPF